MSCQQKHNPLTSCNFIKLVLANMSDEQTQKLLQIFFDLKSKLFHTSKSIHYQSKEALHNHLSEAEVVCATVKSLCNLPLLRLP